MPRSKATLDALIADAVSGRLDDPDEAFDPQDALAIEMPEPIRDAVAELVVVYGCDVLDGDHPVPMFLRLHAEGRTLEDLATTMAVHARWSMRRDLARAGRSAYERRVDARRSALVLPHLASCGPMRGMYHPELAEFLVGMGHHWSGFHVQEDVDIATGGTVAELRDLMAIGGHFGHLARFVAELALLDDGGLGGPGSDAAPWDGA